MVLVTGSCFLLAVLARSIAQNSLYFNNETCSGTQWVPEFCSEFVTDGKNSAQPCEKDDRTIANACWNITEDTPIELNVCFLRLITGYLCWRRIMKDDGQCLGADSIPCITEGLKITGDNCVGIRGSCDKILNYSDRLEERDRCRNLCVERIKVLCGRLSIRCSNFSTPGFTTESPTTTYTSGTTAFPGSKPTTELSNQTTKHFLSETIASTTRRNATAAASQGLPVEQWAVMASLSATVVMTGLVALALIIRRRRQHKKGPRIDDLPGTRRIENNASSRTSRNNAASTFSSNRAIPGTSTAEMPDGAYSEITDIQPGVQCRQYSTVSFRGVDRASNLEQHYEQITPQIVESHAYAIPQTYTYILHPTNRESAAQLYTKVRLQNQSEHAYASLHTDNVNSAKINQAKHIAESINGKGNSEGSNTPALERQRDIPGNESTEDTGNPYFILEKQGKSEDASEIESNVDHSLEYVPEKGNSYYTLEKLDVLNEGTSITSELEDVQEKRNSYFILKKLDEIQDMGTYIADTHEEFHEKRNSYYTLEKLNEVPHLDTTIAETFKDTPETNSYYTLEKLNEVPDVDTSIAETLGDTPETNSYYTLEKMDEVRDVHTGIRKCLCDNSKVIEDKRDFENVCHARNKLNSNMKTNDISNMVTRVHGITPYTIHTDDESYSSDEDVNGFFDSGIVPDEGEHLRFGCPATT